MMKRLLPNAGFKHYYNVFTSDLRTYGLFALIFSGFLWLSQTNFISHSEFWAIACGKLLGSLEGEAIFILMRPLFYVPLSLPFLWDLDNIEHVKMARGLFGLLASVNLLLCFRLVQSLGFSKTIGYFYCGFLLSFQVVFYNFYRVRSDFLSMFFFLTSLNLILSATTSRWRSLPFHPLLPISVFAMSLSTPKSVYLILLVFLIFFVKLREKRSRIQSLSYSLLVIISPASFFILASQLVGFSSFMIHEVFAMALKYYLESFNNSLSTESLSALSRSLQINFLHYAVILACCCLTLYQRRLRTFHEKTIALLFGGALLALMIHPERWDYFIAMLVPFISLPVLYGLEHIQKLRFRMAGLIILILVPLHMTYFQPWWVTNRYQLKRMEELSLVIDHFENVRLFDATGILPRGNNFLWFLGVNDVFGNQATVRALEQEQPELILETPKFEFGGPDLLIILHKYYEEVGPGFWVRKDMVSQFQSIHYPEWQRNWGSLFVYDVPIRYRKLW